jgi:hypothetical protein
LHAINGAHHRVFSFSGANKKMDEKNSREEFTSREISRRVAYTLAAGAAAVTQNAYAEVVYSGTQDIEILQGQSQTIQFDMDEYGDVKLKNYIFGRGNYQGLTVNFFPGKVVGFQIGNVDYVTALAPGFVLDSVSTGPDFKGSLAYGTANPNAQFKTIADGYIGLSFPVGGNTEDVLHFAWMRVDIDNTAGTFIIRDWAWESEAGAPITVGDIGDTSIPGDFNLDGNVDGLDFLLWQRGGSPTGTSPMDLQEWQNNYGAASLAASVAAVPEPITLGLLACGSIGLLLLRRARI